PRISLAQISLSRGQYQAALQFSDEALVYDRNSKASQHLRALALMGLRRYADARREIHSLLRDEPNDTEAQLALAVLHLAVRGYSLAEVELRQIYRPGQADL